MVYGRCVKAFWGAVGNGGYYLCGDKDNAAQSEDPAQGVVICSKFITFAVTKTTSEYKQLMDSLLWFAQNSLPLRWQRQQTGWIWHNGVCCDLLKIHYLCGDKDNDMYLSRGKASVVICSKFITFAVTKTTLYKTIIEGISCDLLKIHYLCGDKDNLVYK